MAIHIDHLNIKHFRGIHNLEVGHLNHINIIAGDNNSGKTSMLEAILLLRDPSEFTNILRIARMRDLNISFGGTTLYENFINLFPRDVSGYEIALQALCETKPVSVQLSGQEKKVMMSPEDIAARMYPTGYSRKISKINADMSEVDAFSGHLIYDIGGRSGDVPVSLDAYATVSGREIKKNSFLKMEYLAPSDHIRGNTFGRILNDISYKEICLHILRIFDPDIQDIFLLKNEENNRYIEYVQHRVLGKMPLSTYGDGIKKVLSLANGIAKASGGILLIDEIDTSLHAKYYDDIFGFLVKACIQFDVQAYITTHSIEAIDGLLSTQDYERQEENDAISVITFKKEMTEKKTYTRVLPGCEVYKNREQFGFEVRL